MVKNNKQTKLLSVLVVVILSYWSIKELYVPGLFPMHDDTQVARVFTMYTSLKDGMFPVRWVTDLGYGYGYPIFNFYAPLAYYIGALFMFFGADALAATKLMIGTGILVSVVTMYFLARKLWGPIGAIISALLYLYAPYHALNVFVRGDIAEVWAYAFIPLIFYGVLGVYQAIQEEKKKGVWKHIVGGALGYAGVILSHNLTAMMITPFIMIFMVLLTMITSSKQKPYAIRYMLYAFVLGILLASFYWIPTFGEMQHTNVLSQIGGGADYKDHFVCPSQLVNSPWGFGGSTAGCVDGMSFKIGKLHILLTTITFMLLPLLYKKDKKTFTLFITFISFTILSVLLMLPLTKPVWDVIPLMKFFQFPWRFLMITSVFTSLLAGGMVYILQPTRPLPTKFSFIATMLVSMYIVFSYASLFKPQTIVQKTAKDYTSQHALRWVASKISDEYMPKGFIEPEKAEDVVKSRVVAKKNIASIKVIKETTTNIRLQINNTDTGEGTTLVKVAPFPAWHVSENATMENTKEGIILRTPKSPVMVDLTFKQTWIEHLGNMLSISGIGILLLGIMYERKANYGKKAS